MAIEKTFIKEGIKESQIESFLKERFNRAGYSHTEIQRTPVGTRIIVYAHKPGLVIGRSGKRVNDITEEIKVKFGFENPLIDVHEVREPMLDANIVSSRVAAALERGINYKRVCNFYLDRVMEVGAVGIQIKVAGKLSGVERSRFQKFHRGFVAHSGDYSEKMVDKGYAQAMLKPGIVGVQVRIMKEMPVEVTRKMEEEVGKAEGKVVEEKVEAAPEAETKEAVVELEKAAEEKAVEKEKTVKKPRKRAGRRAKKAKVEKAEAGKEG